MPPLCAADIDSAAKRIAPVITPTPLQLSDRLSAITGAQIYLKREDLQVVRSYKLRGAYNLMVQLTEDEIAAGVVCSSAGNHAQGFAYACRTLGVRGRVYVPAKTPKQKRDRIRYHGGEFIELIVGGSTYDLAAEAALADVERTGATLVPPYDDPRTMAGQGTIAVEVLEQLGGAGPRRGPRRRRRLHRRYHHLPRRAHLQHRGAGYRAGRRRRDDGRAGRR